MSNASFTAAAIGAGFVSNSNSKVWNHLVSPDLAKLADFFVSQGIKALPKNLGYAFIKVIQSLPNELQKSLYTKIVTPGFTEHLALRKLMIDQQVQDAVNQGNKQIVVLGAGYDVQSMEWSLKYPEIQIFEIDYGLTHTVKKSCIEHIRKKDSVAIKGLGGELVEKYYKLGDNLHLIDCDLGQNDILDILKEEGLDLKKSTVVIAEGFTMFLTKKQLNNFFLKIYNLIGKDGRFILSFSQPERKKRVVASALQKEANENFKSEAMPEEVPEIMGKCGFEVCGTSLFLDMQWQAGNGMVLSKHQSKPCLPKEDYYVARQRSTSQNNTDYIKDIPKILIKIPERIGG